MTSKKQEYGVCVKKQQQRQQQKMCQDDVK